VAKCRDPLVKFTVPLEECEKNLCLIDEDFSSIKFSIEGFQGLSLPAGRQGFEGSKIIDKKAFP
jgi:hypothetical protein